jgi:hypothetical protein
LYWTRAAEDAVLRAVFDISQVFALIWGEGGYVDQADDVRCAGRGVGDDRAAVKCGQQHRAVDLVEQAGGVGGTAARRAAFAGAMTV